MVSQKNESCVGAPSRFVSLSLSEFLSKSMNCKLSIAFPYLAKQAFSFMRDNVYAKIIGNMAFVIEGRNDNELPEVLIGGFTVFYPDPDVAIRSSDFFRSFKNE
jgi:hypothetical protein